MRSSALGLLGAGTFALAAFAPGLALAQSGNPDPAAVVLGPSFAYAPAYYYYAPGRAPAYAAGYAEVAPLRRRHVVHALYCGDVYPPDTYGPHLCGAPPRP